MKSERRHELETNYLADWLGKHMTEYAPYAKGIFGVLIIAITLLVLFRYLSAQQVQERQVAWQEYFTGVTDYYKSENVEPLEELAKAHADTPAAAWAWQSTGDALIYDGAAKLHVDRAEAKEMLTGARDAYQKAFDEADGAMLQQRALLGLAQASEGLNELDQAKMYYQKIIDKWSDKALGHLAHDRLALLNAQSTQAFYAWFVEQEPPERTSPDADSGTGGTSSIHSDLPEVPGLALPSLEDLNLDTKSLQAPEGTVVEDAVEAIEVEEDVAE